MMEPRLESQLGALELKLRRARLLKRLALCWAVAAAVCVLLFLLSDFAGANVHRYWMLPLVAGAMAAGIAWMRSRRRPSDFPALIASMEREHPELRHLLSAAAEQEPEMMSGHFRFLQRRVIDSVLKHKERRVWEESLDRRLLSAGYIHLAAFCGFLFVLYLGLGATDVHSPFASWMAKTIEVAPGDTEVERGTGLVITARFGRKIPPEATLVLLSASGKTTRMPLERHLADPVFGASLPEVTEGALYHVEYDGKKTRDYKIGVFDFPALVRADADLQFPAYTGLTNKTIRDTRRVSAVENSRLTYTLQLNKPVVRARLVGTNQMFTLSVQTGAVAVLPVLTLTNSGRYGLELVDADGRTNKVPVDFSIVVLPDRVPELKLAFPRGDPRVSRLAELQLQAEATDDFGLLKHGVGFGLAGQDPQFVELGQSAPANEKRQFGHLIPLESMGLEAGQVVAYFAWADDYGPNGEVRRTFSDMFFADVRPFEEILRPDESGGGGGGGGGGNQPTQLADLQKQIAIATWKLQQMKGGAPSAQK